MLWKRLGDQQTYVPIFWPWDLRHAVFSEAGFLVWKEDKTPHLAGLLLHRLNNTKKT